MIFSYTLRSSQVLPLTCRPFDGAEKNMNKLHIGGGSSSESTLNTSSFQRTEILLRLQHAKMCGPKAENGPAVDKRGNPTRLVLAVTNPIIPKGTARLLTESEVNALRESKMAVANHVMRILNASKG